MTSIKVMCIDYISGKISESQILFFPSLVVLHVLKLLEAFWSNIYLFEILGHVLQFEVFFSIELFSSSHYTILSCQKCIKIIVVERIEDDIESNFLLT